MFTIAICDDCTETLELFSDYINLKIIKENLDMKILFLASNYNDMDNFITTSEANLYILDIDLKEHGMNKNGYVLAEKIRRKLKTAIIVFITGSQYGYMHKGYDINAFHFLIKPFDYDILYNTIISAYDLYNAIYESKATNSNKDNDIVFNITSDNILYRINLNNIVFIEKVGIANKTRIKLVNGTFLESKMTISVFENLDKEYLIRTHKSFICNKNHIESINFTTQEIIMTDKSKCLLGRTYKDNIKIILDTKLR